MAILRPTQIIDLDGCISDDRWRRHNIQLNSHPNPNEWFRYYHSLCTADAVANTNQLIPGARIVVITSRPLKIFDLTEKWLHYKNILPFVIMMRNPYDYRPSVEVKRSALTWLLSYYDVYKDEIVDAIDDREDVVAMYKAEGLPARVVRIGDEESM